MAGMTVKVDALHLDIWDDVVNILHEIYTDDRVPNDIKARIDRLLEDWRKK